LTGLTGPSYQSGWAYGANGRPTGVETRTASGVAATAVYVYDDRNFVAELSEDGRQTSYRYDARGQLIEVITPAGDVIRYGFDGSGNRTCREAVVSGRDVDRSETITAEELTRLILKKVRDKDPGLLERYRWQNGQDGQEDNPDGRGKGGGNAGQSAAEGTASGAPAKGNGNDKDNGNGGGNGNDDNKLTGRENALTRGNGLKIGSSTARPTCRQAT